MSWERVTRQVQQYYTAKLETHGATPSGVDWNSEQSQTLRFDRLLRVSEGRTAFTLLDYGCGYGALADHLDHLGLEADYTGFDLSEAMVEEARARHPHRTFTSDQADLPTAEFTVASGIFNVRLETPVAEWEAYVADTVDDLAAHSQVGFAFNVLTSYSDPERMRPDLYYADPLKWFDRCARRFGRLGVALAQDYGLFEFTLGVRIDRS